METSNENDVSQIQVFMTQDCDFYDV